jgi:hypothetical protein
MSAHQHTSLALGLFIIAAASTVQAQGIAGSYEQLRQLVELGDRVRVVQGDGTEVAGEILDLSSSSLALQVKGVRVEVPERDVRTIRMRRPDSLRNGALWGFGAGAAFLVVATLREGDSLGMPTVLIGAVFGGIGAGMGVGVDAIIMGRQVVYARPGASSARVRVSPLLARDRHGAQLSVRF